MYSNKVELKQHYRFNNYYEKKKESLYTIIFICVTQIVISKSTVPFVHLFIQSFFKYHNVILYIMIEP